MAESTKDEWKLYVYTQKSNQNETTFGMQFRVKNHRDFCAIITNIIKKTGL